MTAHPAQPELFRPCAWCGHPGTVEIEVEPAVVRTSKASGKDVVIKAPIMAWACTDHLRVLQDRSPNIASVRRRKARDVEQLSFLDAPAKGPGSAIFGDRP